MNAGEVTVKHSITFMLDGQAHTPPPFAPDTTLLNYLREHLYRKGTKEGCAEGDCGACTVVVADLQHGSVRYRALNACIQLLATLDGKALFTVESLQHGKQLHPVQQALVDCHASQCGFCTPGFVMSLFALYQNQPNASRLQISQALSGNLCRCTGYRPILEAGERMYEYAHAFPNDDLAETTLITTLTQWAQQPHSLLLEHDGKRFCAPTSLGKLAILLERYPDATLLAGATDVGLWITKQHRDLPTLISLNKVAGLDQITTHAGWLEIAAAVSLEAAFQAIVAHYPSLRELHERFASLPIRNAGTLGGNIANGSPIGDSMPALLVLGARIRLRKGDATRELPLEAFYLAYQQKDLAAGEFVEAVRIPLPNAATGLLRCYKISKRFEQDISAVCAAFHIQLDAKERVTEARIAYGGMAGIPKRASHCEAALSGQAWEQASVTAAMKALEHDFQPLTDMRASATYRMNVAKNLLLKYLLETTGESVSLYATGVQA
ncbi:xanthine dehydrogenase small subunit [Thiothrix subterranea]|uniref:Xanthine dehydrogenase small subunit n=1 Tax=Thiothrix subterranea TaxID=2735563 RepID=A0AA51R544_9GAMM|nr:xanthine dehydrogenase small subunit [Thiothrix subterranea]MDQ5769147.1 xanthine dehydrogenase small subunit [Thiothrix subterranea]WML87306.1 xanthine dehydrogenase small subunit [Thiothrix subterranea]